MTAKKKALPLDQGVESSSISDEGVERVSDEDTIIVQPTADVASLPEGYESQIEKAVRQQMAINANIGRPGKKTRIRKARKVVPGANGAVRVLKVVKKDATEENYVYQFRYPRADKLWDRGRLNQELEQLGMIRTEEANLPKYCELKDCWAVLENEQDSFCNSTHRRTALKAHDRMLAF